MSLAHSLPFLYQDKEMITLNIPKLSEQFSEITLNDYYHLHENPELSTQEKETTAYIVSRLREIGLEPKTDYPEYGVTALIQGAFPGKTILLRADYDALPVSECTGFEHASHHPGVMHACGHDTHTAGLLGAARILNAGKASLHGTVKLCFQPAEEVPHHGARIMVEAGALENPKVDFSAGLHVSPEFQIGEAYTKTGPVSAYGDRLFVTVRGKGAHGSSPQYANDPVGAVLMMCNMILEFRGRFAPGDGVLIQITRLQAGEAENVIPEEASFGVCIRAHSRDNREKIKSGIRKIVKEISAFYGMRYTAKGFQSDFPIVINDAMGVQLASESIRKLGMKMAKPSAFNTFGSEDFGYFANESGVPGVFVYSGSANEDPATHYSAHNPKFRVDERVVMQNARILAQIAADYLNG